VAVAVAAKAVRAMEMVPLAARVLLLFDIQIHIQLHLTLQVHLT
jgi:hypothetical protein